MDRTELNTDSEKRGKLLFIAGIISLAIFLTKVLQGRDEQTQLFYKKAFEAIEVGSKTYTLVENMNKNHTELMKMLVEHLKPGVTINNQSQK